MKKRTKISLVLSSAAAILLAGSIMAGGTFALFTSESKTNIAVTSGKVDVSATLSDLKLFSGDADSLVGDTTTDSNKIIDTTSDGKFTNGGTATLDDDSRNLTISNVTPGDKVTLNIKVHNDSNVNIKYRTIIKAVNNTGLYEGLTVKLGNEEYHGNTLISKYATLAENSEDIILPVEIGLPSDKTNEFQGKSTTISFTVEAIQGNAATTDAADTDYLVYTPTDLTVFADLVSKGTFTYTNVLFKDNIDMKGVKYVSPRFDSNSVYRHGLNIVGNNCTISNFAPVHNGHGSGLFGNVFGGGNAVNVSNLKFETVTISGDYENEEMCGGGAIVGVSDHGIVNISNVEVKSVNVSKVKYGGALVGYSSGDTTITSCTVNNSTIAAYTAGGVLGQVGGSTTTIESLNGSNVSVDGTKREGGVVGAVSGGVTLNINKYNIEENSYSSTVSRSVVDGGATGEIVGLKSDNTYVNGTKLTD